MTFPTVKICGLKDEDALRAAINNGAAYVGFVFVPASRRYVATEQAAKLAALASTSVKRVGLFVDPDDDTLRGVCKTVPLDMIQLHGHETPERVAAVRALTGLPVMKALAIATDKDFEMVPAYEAVADMLLFDTKTSEGSGGTGMAFDWSLLQGKRFNKPWMLAGGLTPENVAEAIATTGAQIVDVSSGVETNGQKDPERIKVFLLTCRNASKN